MFEKSIEKDLQTATTDAERESIYNEVYDKYRKEFLAFIEELKENGIVQKMYNSSTPEETISMWEEYSSKNQELFTRIKSWAEGRIEYFNTYESIPLFEEGEKVECILEIGLIIFIVEDESILNEEDINESFNKELITLLKNNSNPFLKAAGCYIDYNGYESITKERIYDLYSEE